MNWPDLTTLLAAAGWGVVHALTPCAHSWPVLVPLVGRSGSAVRPGVWFGLGMLLSSVGVGVIVGGVGKAVIGDAAEAAENVIAGLVILLGLLLAVRPRWMHAGHMHGACDPAGGEQPREPGCGHGAHRPSRFLRFGRDGGVLLLGFANMAVPCWSNGAGVTLAVQAHGAAAGGIALGVYGLAAGVTMVVVLAVVRRGLGLASGIASPRFENALLRASGALMILYGAALLLHIGHDHGRGG